MHMPRRTPRGVRLLGGGCHGAGDAHVIDSVVRGEDGPRVGLARPGAADRGIYPERRCARSCSDAASPTVNKVMPG